MIIRFSKATVLFFAIIIFVFLISACSNPVPEISVPDQTVSEGDELSFDLSKFTKLEGKDELSYSLISGVGSISGSIYAYRPSFTDAGDKKVTVIARTSKGKEASATFTVKVIDVNRPPKISSLEPMEVSKEGELRIDLSKVASDDDGDIITFEISGSSYALENNYLILRGRDLKYGTNAVTITVRDSKGATASTEFSVTVPVVSSSATGKTLVVDKDGEFQTIQKAVDSAKAGDTVFILPGTYEENITVSKAITLAGSSKDDVIVVGLEDNTAAIYIRSTSGVTIKGLTIRHSGPAIQISRSTVEIDDCVLMGGRFGISFSGTSANILKVSRSLFSAFESLTNDKKLSDRLTAMYIYGSGEIVVEDCLFFRNGTGLYVSNEIVFSITDCVFDSNTIALSITGTSRGTVDRNKITGSIDNGVLLRSTSTVEFKENLIYGNARHGFDLYLRSCTDCGCGGTVFNGTVLGSGNVFDDEKAICPRDFSWPEGFYTVDEQISKTN